MVSRALLSLVVSLLLAAWLLPSPGTYRRGTAGRRATARAPEIEARSKPVIRGQDGLAFKDSNGSGTLDPYEDWRLSPEERARDLVARMTIGEKAGMMLIDTLNAPVAPKGIESTDASRYVNDEHMTRFVFRNVVTEAPSTARTSAWAPASTPLQAAEFTNAVQEMAEATRLGIPVIFKSNARNHYERHARQGINEAAGAFSEFPKEAGLAATRDMALIRGFAETMGAEWNAIGLRAMYGYMADLSTEPRWYRVHETFTEDADLCAEIMTVLVQALQGGRINRQSKVALTVKHFPGGGPQELGLDPHYTFGKRQVYPARGFAEHLKPFRAAIAAGASSIMPYYGVPVDVRHDGRPLEPIGMAFSKLIVTDLLRAGLGFRGYVNSDTGIINDRAWGLERRTVPERVAAAINAGVDVLSGFHSKGTIVELVGQGLVSEARVDEAATRLLVEQFALGLFEDPYVDAAAAGRIIGKPPFRQRAIEAQRKSLVLLKNDNGVLPLRAPDRNRPVRLYTLGLNPEVVGSQSYGSYLVVAGNRGREDGQPRTPVPPGTDYVLIAIEAINPRQVTSTYKSTDAATGGRTNPASARAWGAEDQHELDNGLRFGGAFPWEADLLAFSQMASAASWQISPPLADVRGAMREAGDPKKVVISIYFRQPYVLDEASGLRNAGAIVANFGVSDAALMDVLTGRFSPAGKLPFALAGTADAIVRQAPDAPGYAAADTLFPFGFGLTYATTRPGTAPGRSSGTNH